jgi:hypothetical protein
MQAEKLVSNGELQWHRHRYATPTLPPFQRNHLPAETFTEDPNPSC